MNDDFVMYGDWMNERWFSHGGKLNEWWFSNVRRLNEWWFYHVGNTYQNNWSIERFTVNPDKWHTVHTHNNFFYQLLSQMLLFKATCSWSITKHQVGVVMWGWLLQVAGCGHRGVRRLGAWGFWTRESDLPSAIRVPPGWGEGYCWLRPSPFTRIRATLC